MNVTDNTDEIIEIYTVVSLINEEILTAFVQQIH